MNFTTPYGYKRTRPAAAYAASPAAAAVAKADAAAAEAAAAHVPLTKEAFDKLYAHITCPPCKSMAIFNRDPNYKCTHKRGGAKKKSRRLRRGKSKSKFQRRGKSVKRRRRH